MKFTGKKDLDRAKKAIPTLTTEEKLKEAQALIFITEAQTPESLKEKRKAKELEIIQLLSGENTSEFNEKKKLKDLISSIPVDRDSKFSEFFEELGRLAGWTDEQRKSYRKPILAPLIINKTIYARFPKEVIEHIHKNNPYFRWCLRKFKNYAFLGEDGILYLEEYIFDAVLEMQSASSVPEFLLSHAEKFGLSYQTELFKTS